MTMYMHMCKHRYMHTHAHTIHTVVQELLTVANELGVDFLFKKIKAFSPVLSHPPSRTMVSQANSHHSLSTWRQGEKVRVLK